MDCSDSVPDRISEKDREAIGDRNGEEEAQSIGHDGIAIGNRTGRADEPDYSAMNLPGKSQRLLRYVK
jgi:hypothetical protein